MVFTTWADVLNQSFQGLLSGLIGFIPNLVIAIIIFIIGWLIGLGLERIVKQVIDALRIDTALKAAGVERIVERAGYRLSSGLFIGILVKWFVIVVFLVAAVVADAAQRVVTGTARAAGLQGANLLGSTARYAIWIFAILAALAQLQVATAFVQTLFMGVVIAVSLAVGLAFGLGGQQAAARFLEHLRGSIKD